MRAFRGDSGAHQIEKAFLVNAIASSSPLLLLECFLPMSHLLRCFANHSPDQPPAGCWYTESMLAAKDIFAPRRRSANDLRVVHAPHNHDDLLSFVAHFGARVTRPSQPPTWRTSRCGGGGSRRDPALPECCPFFSGAFATI